MISINYWNFVRPFFIFEISCQNHYLIWNVTRFFFLGGLCKFYFYFLEFTISAFIYERMWFNIKIEFVLSYLFLFKICWFLLFYYIFQPIKRWCIFSTKNKLCRSLSRSKIFWVKLLRNCRYMFAIKGCLP